MESGASAVAAASIFQYTEITPKMIKEELAKSGVEVRL
jgi:imidazole glycerol phosphate synthase subunit HisF